MLNFNQLTTRLLFATLIVFISISCQKDSVNEEIDLIDEDMLTATQLADEYLYSTTGRTNHEKAITVLKFYDGKLLYATNTDDYNGYFEVTEETVTATISEDEYVFWFSGGGVTDLEGIEFDDESQAQLSDDPEEINMDRMWMITGYEEIESEDDEDVTYLKYDIVYDYFGNEGDPIRLDPKLKVTH